MTILTRLQACRIFGMDVAVSMDSGEVKAKYRELALRWHPDRPGGDQAHFKCVQEAYQILTGKLESKGAEDAFASTWRTSSGTSWMWSLEALVRDLEHFAETSIRDKETNDKFLTWMPELTQLGYYPRTYFSGPWNDTGRLGLHDYLENVVIPQLQHPVWKPTSAEEASLLHRYGTVETDAAEMWKWRFYGRAFERDATWDEGPWSTKTTSDSIRLLEKAAQAYWKGGVAWKARDAENGMIGRAFGYWDAAHVCPFCKGEGAFKIRKSFRYSRHRKKERNTQNAWRRYRQHLKDAHGVNMVARENG